MYAVLLCNDGQRLSEIEIQWIAKYESSLRVVAEKTIRNEQTGRTWVFAVARSGHDMSEFHSGAGCAVRLRGLTVVADSSGCYAVQNAIDIGMTDMYVPCSRRKR